GWLKGVLGDKVDEVRQSSRLVDSPAIIVNLDENLTSSMQRVMQAMNRDLGNLGRKALEVNTRHKLIKRLAGLREEDPEFARLVAEQVYDNAVISAGLAIEPRAMIERIYRILDRV
ncbi:MAG: molecular chaperone HtpG, partial [Eubacteriales bacterium]